MTIWLCLLFFVILYSTVSLKMWVLCQAHHQRCLPGRARSFAKRKNAILTRLNTRHTLTPNSNLTFHLISSSCQLSQTESKINVLICAMFSHQWNDMVPVPYQSHLLLPCFFARCARWANWAFCLLVITRPSKRSKWLKLGRNIFCKRKLVETWKQVEASLVVHEINVYVAQIRLPESKMSRNSSESSGKIICLEVWALAWPLALCLLISPSSLPFPSPLCPKLATETDPFSQKKHNQHPNLTIKLSQRSFFKHPELKQNIPTFFVAKQLRCHRRAASLNLPNGRQLQVGGRQRQALLNWKILKVIS